MMTERQPLEPIVAAIPKETAAGERRVALIPELIPRLRQAGLAVLVQSGAGSEAGFPDSSYIEKGARIESEVLDKADIVLKVQPPNLDEVGKMQSGATLIGFLQPYAGITEIQALAARGVTAFSMEIGRAHV